MNKLLDRHKWPKLTQEEIENLNRPIMSKDTELVIKTLCSKKRPDLDGFIGEFY